MTILEIARAYEYRCDACETSHIQKNANGHYTNSTPPLWTTLSLLTESSGSKRILLCAPCALVITTAYADLMERNSKFRKALHELG